MLYLWEQVWFFIDEQGLIEFQEMKLLLTSNSLNDWTHDRTWISALSKFFGKWSEAVDAAHLTEDFYDIGKEVILPGRSHHFDAEPEEPAVFLTWRRWRCCLEGFSHWLWDVVNRIDQPPEPQTISHRVTRSAHPASPHPATDTRSDPLRPRDKHEEAKDPDLRLIQT